MTMMRDALLKRADDEFRPLGMNLSTVGRFGGAGLMGGASVATALMFVKMLKDLSEDKAAREGAAADDGTITLTLPKRAGVDTDCGAECPVDAGPVKHTDRSEDNDRLEDHVPKKPSRQRPKVLDMAITTPDQMRSVDGRYGVKMANWQTLAASLLALGAGGTVGFSLINKIYDARREKELQGDLTRAKQEYLDQLGSAAGAGVKTADTGASSFSTMDYPMGLTALLYLLGTGGTAWMTKKFLDEYNKSPASTFKPSKRPHIDRILFRTADENDKIASADDGSRECFDAALGIYLDICSGQSGVVGSPECEAAVKSAGMDAEGLYKMASQDFDDLMMFLKANPELRRTVRNVAMDQHPLLKYFKWAAGIPGISNFADMKVREGLNTEFGPQAEIWRQAKQAGILPSLLGTTLAGSAGGTVASALAQSRQDDESEMSNEVEKAVIPETKEERDAKIDRMISDIQIGAGDPDAARFVKENSGKLRQILIVLAEEGKI